MTSVHQHQHAHSQIAQRVRIAVLGPLGTYTHEAAYKAFGDNVEYEERKSIADTIHAVQESVAIGVVPQENTIFGSVAETYDGLRQAKCGFVKGEVTLQIQHCLLVQRGVQFHEIGRVLSHEQALGQCQKFLKTHLPNAALVKTTSTASAAQSLLTSPRNCAAICSKICATIFEGLEILQEGIQKEADNYTRFYILVRDREIELPAASQLTTQNRALIRLWISPIPPSGQHQTKDVLHYLALSGLGVVRIDRRPSDDGIPFRNIYFVEIASTAAGLLESEQSRVIRPWCASVADALNLVRNMGGEIDLIGLW